MKRHPIRTGILILIFTALAFFANCQEPTRLQLLFTNDKAKAEIVAQQINGLGLGPSEIRDTGNGYKVLTRAFDSYGEANFHKTRVREAGFSDTFAVKDNATPRPVYGEVESIVKSQALKNLRIDFQPAEKPVEHPKITDAMQGINNEKAGEEELFSKASAFCNKEDSDEAIRAIDAFIRRFPKSEKTAQAKMMKGYWLLKKNDTKAAREQFEKVTREHPAKTEAGEAHLRCAYLMLRDKSPDPEILKRFLIVARREVPCKDDVRLEAMLRCAALYYRMKDLDTAEAAYEVIEEATQDAEIRSFSQMQRAGILLEKAYNGKVPYSMSRQICDDLLKRYPNVNIQTRSTAALMAVESLCRESKYEEVVKRSEKYIKEYKNTPEAPVAYYWLAKSFYETGNSQMALQLLENLIETRYETEQRFKYIDVNDHARLLASKIYREMGNTVRAEEVLRK